MDLTALLLSRLQFAFTVSFHIIFPSFTIGLAAWLTVLEALHLSTGRPAYRLVFEFWLKIFGVAFGLGVVSGIVMAFQFGTNWSVLSRMSGPIQGAAALLRDLHRLFPRGELLRDPAVWPLSRPAVVLFVFDRNGGARHHALGLLDHGQQQLDAGAGRLCDGERRLCSRRLGQDPLQPGAVGALSAHAACVVSDRRVLRRRDRRMVPAAPGICRRGAHHAAHGPVSRGRAGAGPAPLRPPQRRIRRSPPAGEDGRDRGAVARREAGVRGAARLAGRRRTGETCSRSRCPRPSAA